MADGEVRRSELSIASGLYVLRYLAGLDTRSAPSAKVAPTDGSKNDVDVISPPGFGAGELPGPGTSVVVLARQAGKLDIVVTAAEGSSNLDARFTLDMLGVPRPEAYLTSDRAPGHAGVPNLSLSAHVARRGDVEADADGWVGGPQRPSAIEGVAFRSSGADLGIAAQFCHALEPGQWSAWVTPGALVGTRQRASAMTGLRLKLVGSEAGRYEIEAEALFLGSPVSVQQGAEVEFSSAGGRDPLVGLRVGFRPRLMKPIDEAPRQTGRVRVFR